MMIIEKAVVTGISISPDRKRIRCETESLARNYEFWASPHIGGGPGNIQGLFCEMQLGDEIELIGIPVASWNADKRRHEMTLLVNEGRFIDGDKNLS